MEENNMSESTELAARGDLFPVWDPSVHFPSHETMPDPEIITHVVIERAKPDGWHYLHEATIQWHKDRFYAAFANHRIRETGDHNEIIRGCTSPDGLHWSEPEIWCEPPLIGANSYNHPLLFSHGGVLYGFFVCWDDDHNPHTEIFTLDESTELWIHHPASKIPMFLPFCTPQKMEDGNWILGGENHWYYGAAAISRGDDLLHWDFVRIPRDDDFKILFPECAIVNHGNGHLLAVCRPYCGHHPHLIIENQRMTTAPVSESFDYGRSWTKLALSNYPLDESQPFAGRLSTGQNYLITNSLEEGRALLSIAVTEPGGKLFRRVYKVRHQKWPARRLFGGFGGGTYAGKPTEWSYPNAFEHDGKLYIAYTQGKEDCVLTIIPVGELKA